MISDAERAALKTIQEMVDREKDLHKQVDLFTDFTNAVAGALGIRENCWMYCSAPDAILGDVVRVVRQLAAFKAEYEGVKRDRCDTCCRYRQDIRASDPDDTTSRFCDWHEKFFWPDFYCKDWHR